MQMQKLFSNKWLQIALNQTQGTLTFADSKGKVIISEAYWDYSGIPKPERKNSQVDFQIVNINDDSGGKGKEVTLKSRGDIEQSLILRGYSNQPYLLFKQQIINRTSSPIKFDKLFPLEASSIKITSVNLGTLSSYRVFVNTWGKTPATVSDLLPAPEIARQPDIRHTGFWDGALYNRQTKKCLVIGCLTAKRWVSRISFEYQSLNHINLYCEQYLGEKLLKPNESEESEWWYLDYSTPILNNYLQYGALVGKAMNAKRYDYSPAAFDVWHEFRDEFNENVLLRNARFVKEHPEYFPICPGGLEYILADLGWAKAIGQNEVDTRKFPKGMKYVADEIHKLGLKAGTYMTPFWISSQALVFFQHPEWLLKNRKGELIIIRDFAGNTSAGILDCTNPDAQEYIRKQIRLIIQDWGFDCLKLDFMEKIFHEHFSSADPEKKPEFYANDSTVVENYRLGCQIMFDEVNKLNPKAIIAPFTIPTNPSIGIFPMNCTAEDAVHPYLAEPAPWGDHFGSDHQVRTWALRYWMHNQIWTNHSESILVRKPRPLHEAIFLTTAAALSGGMICIGDDLTRLPKERLNIVSKIFPLLGQAAIPVDLFEKINPQIWNLFIQKDNRQWNVVGLFNWEFDRQEIYLDFRSLGLNDKKDYLAFEFWTQAFTPIKSGEKIIIPVAGRTVALLVFHKELGHPQIIGTDVHYSQGAVEILEETWNPRKKNLFIRFQNPRFDKSRLWVYRDGKYQLRKIISSQKGIKVFSRKDLVYSIIIPKSRTATEVEFFFSKIR